MEEVILKSPKDQKRIKSATRYPKKLPAYVVAFAVNEKFDESMTKPPEFLGSSQSLQESINSGYPLSVDSSTDSKKTLIQYPSGQILNSLDTPSISDVKIDISYDNNIGDITMSPPFNIDNSSVIDDDAVANRHPCAKFYASKRRDDKDFSKRLCRVKTKKRKRKVIILRNIQFKCRKSQYIISKKLHQHCKELHSERLSRIAYTSKKLKKVPSKENLFAKASLEENSFFGEIYNMLQPSSKSKRNTYARNASEDIISPKSSTTSKIEECYSIDTVNSVIQVSSDITPYKTDIINLGVVVTQKNNLEQVELACNIEKLQINHKTSIPSNETFLLPKSVQNPQALSISTLKQTDENHEQSALDEYQMSIGTLKKSTDKRNSFIFSDSDTYELAKNYSNYNNSILNSELTLVSNSETLLRSENNCTDQFCFGGLAKHNLIPDSTGILDTVINLGMFPQIATSTSYSTEYNNDPNKVIIMKNLVTNYGLNSKSKGDEQALHTLSKNVLKKSFDEEQSKTGPQKNLILPNEDVIKAFLKENELFRKSLDEKSSLDDSDSYPTNVPEMWDRLILVLDLAVKRLEETLADKIVKELKISLPDILKTYSAPSGLVTKPDEIIANEVPHIKEVIVEERPVLKGNSGCVQCDLVQNRLIDELMLKLSSASPKVLPNDTGISIQKLKEPTLLQDELKVLKLPAVRSYILDVDKAETLTVSRTTPCVEGKFGVIRKLKTLALGPLSFVRENMFVITSVPIFLFVLFCFYSAIVFMAKPW